jgi:hypothetical protein
MPPTSSTLDADWRTDALAGGAAGILTDLIFYSLDSAKVRAQAGRSMMGGGGSAAASTSSSARSLFRGALPTAIFGSAPSFAAFFAAYVPIKAALDLQSRAKSSGSGGDGASTNEATNVLIASMLGGIPSSIAGVPSDVVKKRMFAGGLAASATPSWVCLVWPDCPPLSSVARSIGMLVHGSSGRRLTPLFLSLHIFPPLFLRSLSQMSAFRQVAHEGGIGGFFLGWRANLTKDVAFAAIKMSLYEGVARAYVQLARPASTSTSSRQTASSSLISDTGARSSDAGSSHGSSSSDGLSPRESALVGLASGALTALATCPIDNVNTRIKSGELGAGIGVLAAHAEVQPPRWSLHWIAHSDTTPSAQPALTRSSSRSIFPRAFLFSIEFLQIVRRDGARALFRGLAVRATIVGLGSTVFWFAFAHCREFFGPLVGPQRGQAATVSSSHQK